MRMPVPDPALLARRAEFIAALRAIVPAEGVLLDWATGGPKPTGLALRDP